MEKLFGLFNVTFFWGISMLRRLMIVGSLLIASLTSSAFCGPEATAPDAQILQQVEAMKAEVAEFEARLSQLSPAEQALVRAEIQRIFDYMQANQKTFDAKLFAKKIVRSAMYIARATCNVVVFAAIPTIIYYCTAISLLYLGGANNPLLVAKESASAGFLIWGFIATIFSVSEASQNLYKLWGYDIK